MRAVPAVTVAVVPRETVSQVQASLENLIGSTRSPYRLVIVDGCYPKRTRRLARRLRGQHDATLLRSDRPLTPNEARNVVLGAVDTEYVVFLDDNCFVRDRCSSVCSNAHRRPARASSRRSTAFGGSDRKGDRARVRPAGARGDGRGKPCRRRPPPLLGGSRSTKPSQSLPHPR